ncbi:DUF339-domain-containing protein [Hypoxylon rubiginosum]|uniref:DUF339-domain-containing protein n=1 Tax=Hypoxylon rubiginosum TaxID=110542 RepID=A0ACB9Z5H4_9PEZI|nr:DUF339-domain-containing protein [Hypoxylon rubiginosum]
MASAAPRSILRAAQRSSSPRFSRHLLLSRRPLGTAPALRASVFPHAPPMEPHKQRPQNDDVGVGELEGTEFRIEPMRRAGEDDATIRARLVYQSRKRGTLEADLLLSTFADTYLPTMTRDQMAQFDRFLDENDWDIYYWATQEPPPNTVSASAESSSSPSPSGASPTTPSIATADTSSPSYAGGAEAAISEATPPPATSTSTHATPGPVSTGGSIRTGDAGEGKEAAAAAAAAAAAEEPYRSSPRETGEWAQTVGTFKPAYRPVPARWRESEVLRLLRDHVKARAQEKGGMAFMPALRGP